jgi:ketosteroid isomerase-like protein
MAQDPSAVMVLFSDDVVYFESTQDPPHVGKEAVFKLWQVVPDNQKDISFEHELLATQDNLGIVHWQAKLTTIPDDKTMQIDGIFKITLNEGGLCSEFKQWETIKYE